MSGAGFKDFFFPKPFRPPLDLAIQSDVIRVSRAHTQHTATELCTGGGYEAQVSKIITNLKDLHIGFCLEKK